MTNAAATDDQYETFTAKLAEIAEGMGQSSLPTTGWQCAWGGVGPTPIPAPPAPTPPPATPVPTPATCTSLVSQWSDSKCINKCTGTVAGRRCNSKCARKC